jgi:hypothetical protein
VARDDGPSVTAQLGQWATVGGVNQYGAQTTPDAQLTARLARLWTVTGHGVDMYHVGCAGAQVALPVEG